MRILANFIKTFKENLRDWKILIMVIVFAPFFVFMMHMYLGDAADSSYNVALLNKDIGGAFTNELIAEWENLKSEDGKSIINIIPVNDAETAIKMIRDRNAGLFVTIPGDFSSSARDYLAGRRDSFAAITSYGDQSDIKYIMSAMFVDYAAFSYAGVKSGVKSPLNIKYESAGTGRKMTEFNLFVPALLVMSIIMMLFTAGVSIVREVEKETIIRLTLSRLSSIEFMSALSMNQVIIGVISLVLTLLCAMSVGYKTDGSIALLILIGVITCFSVISISIITCCFIKNMFGLLTVGCFPFFILMFFSDCFMPLPKISLIKVIGNQLYLNDILPTATATRALNKVLNFQANIGDIQFELIWMVILSVMYFGIGVFLFKKKYNY